ncbi:MAG: protease complex subunit PrcB family protein [Planctomycetes bacterium]|nr:protease complex subunit PrcB family protein [Planctomycetota bacterium]
MRRIRTTSAPLLVTGLLVAAGCGSGGGGGGGKASAAAPVTSAAPLAFRDVHRSDVSGVSIAPFTGMFERVAGSEPEWTALWNEHQHRGAIVSRPQVDLRSETVVAVFLGEQPSSGWAIDVVGVAAIDSHTLEVQVAVTRPTGQPSGTPVNPCHFVAINRTGPLTFAVRDVTQASVTTPLDDVHGELVLAPTRRGGQTLAFLQDGEATPRELTDPTTLTAAGARAGSTLLLTGDAEQNPLGATALPEAVRVVSFTLDDVAVTGALEARAGGTALRDGEGTLYEPVGPLATALLRRPLGRPLRVTGRLEPGHRSAIAGAVGLRVSSHRPTVTIALRVAGGLAGTDNAFTVDDLPRTGAYRLHERTVVFPDQARKGAGRLAEAERAGLERLVDAADLRRQPSVFRPQFPLLDVPTTSLVLADAQGQVTVTIEAGATLPAAVQALVSALQGHAQRAATFRTLERGTYSGVAQPGVTVARDAAALRALWAAHAGTGPGVAMPVVDFSRQVVVAVFQGRQSSGGYGIEVRALERVGDELHLSVTRRTPAPGQVVTLAFTSPYHIVVVDHQGATGDVYVDGARP